MAISQIMIHVKTEVNVTGKRSFSDSSVFRRLTLNNIFCNHRNYQQATSSFLALFVASGLNLSLCIQMQIDVKCGNLTTSMHQLAAR